MADEGPAPALFRGAAGGDAQLLVTRCPSCSRLAFPASDVCPYCGRAGGRPEAIEGDGILQLVTQVTRRPPNYDGPLPYGFGVVELADGLRIVTRVSPADASPGARGRFVVQPLGENETTYEFAAGASAVALEVYRRQPVSDGHSPAPPLTRGRPVYVAGVGIHPFGRFADKTLTQLGVAAVQEALANAGIELRRVEAAYGATVYGGVAAGHKVLSVLGATAIAIVNIEAGCASGAAALSLAALAIAAGQYETVLVFGMEKMERGMIRSSFFEPWRERAGLAVTPAYFALRAQRLMRESGVSVERLAQVSVKNHSHGVCNPYAMYRAALTLEEVMASPLVCEPLRRSMMCSPNEGAAAVVLSAKPPMTKAVQLAAICLRSHLPGNVLGEHTPLSGIADEPPAPSELAARDVYAQLGISANDLDLVELQDTDSARELLSYEDLGLCARGAAGEWLASGAPLRGGKQPVNLSGGLLSKGEPLGASGIAQVIELYWQLRGEAGERQTPNAEIALAHTVGRGANASVTVLTRH